MERDYYEFYKENPEDKIWEVTHYIIKDKSKEITEENLDMQIGEILFSLDKEKIYNAWTDYPHNLTKEEKELFDKEKPYWKEFFKDRCIKQ